MNGDIKEVFRSIQGEGEYVGAPQVFVRFSGCPIGCKGCDTDYSYVESFDFFGLEKFSNPVNPAFLSDKIYDFIKPNSIHSISITGGEPLYQIDFLEEFVVCLKNKGYRLFLETSGFLIDRLNRIGEMFDIISLDFKLKRSFGVEFDIIEIEKIDPNLFNKIYVKVVINNTINELDLNKVLIGLNILNKNKIYLHFFNNSNNITYSVTDFFYRNGIFAYYVPQVHKFLEIR
ncbi:MAG: 4Fe-4S cluster-binding domain-containing protein [Calditerrivibrio sp.]|nr:4Fe-4S cluster-binding domain-containing protein [Calditerrivibrio sp.]MCA1932323.1 4Fe-4S cluster-binding domain-containing protein [Calditerrivibrio sp.]